MNKINALNYSHLKNPQHFNIMDFMKAAIVLYALADGKYGKYITRFFAAFEAEDEAYQKYDRKTLTARIWRSPRLCDFEFLRNRKVEIIIDRRAAVALDFGRQILFVRRAKIF